MPATLQLGRWWLIGLDTHIAERPKGALPEAQVSWLAELAARHAAPHVGIFTHHPPLTIGSRWMDPMGLRGAITPMCAQRAIAFLICTMTGV